MTQMLGQKWILAQPATMGIALCILTGQLEDTKLNFSSKIFDTKGTGFGWCTIAPQCRTFSSFLLYIWHFGHLWCLMIYWNCLCVDLFSIYLLLYYKEVHWWLSLCSYTVYGENSQPITCAIILWLPSSRVIDTPGLLTQTSPFLRYTKLRIQLHKVSKIIYVQLWNTVI